MFMSRSHLSLAAASLVLSAKSAKHRYLAGKLAAIGAFKIGAPTTSGFEVGPDFWPGRSKRMRGIRRACISQERRVAAFGTDGGFQAAPG